MDLDQYIGCVILWNGRPAIVTGATDCYAGCWFSLRYADEEESAFTADAFDPALLNALPDPEFGLLKRAGKDVVYCLNGAAYTLGDHPYEPCTYLRKDGKTVCTLHNAFTVDDLPEWFAEGKTLTAIDGKTYDAHGFCRVLAAALRSGRGEMDFPFAASLARQA